MRRLLLMGSFVVLFGCTLIVLGQQPIVVRPEVPISGPFGLRPGTSKEALTQILGVGSVKEVSEYSYELATVPKPHPKFVQYWVIICPNVGLVKVIAFSRIISTNVFGDSIKEEFDDVARGLTAKYGAENRFDSLKNGSIWTDPQDWTMGLLKGDRRLVAFWTGDPPRNGVTIARLEAEAIGRETGRLNLGYEFAGFSQCADARKLKTDSVY